MVCFPKGLMITPYHPVLSDSCRPHARYQFPIDLVGSDRHDEGGGGAEAKERPPRLIVASNCKSVYSFLLEEQGNDEERGVSAPSSSIVINDRQCLALGHEIWRDPVARHEFFGSRRKVVGNLSSMKGWAQGALFTRPRTATDATTIYFYWFLLILSLILLQYSNR